MSLTFDGIAEAHRAWEKMDERLNKLIGFNPALSNHYGTILLYNVRIDSRTSDEEIRSIRSKYVKWRDGILSILAEYGIIPNEEEFNKMFRWDFMFGDIFFLEEWLDIESDAEKYRASIVEFSKDRAYPYHKLQRKF